MTDLIGMCKPIPHKGTDPKVEVLIMVSEPTSTY